MTLGPEPASTRRFASPLSRVLARRHGLELADLPGSGPRGRIIKADILAFLAAGGAQGPAGPAFVEIPHTAGRRLIARRLTESMQQTPHFYARIDCALDRVLQQRARWTTDDGHKPTVNDFVVHAAARALRDVPAVNASFTANAIRRYQRVNVAVAVAVQDGLLTPVVEDADRKTVAQIAQETHLLAGQARSGTLPAGANRGGTFSVSNLGGLGVRVFTAVINPPQAAILAVGAAEPRAVVRDGAVVVATVMTVVLSADHRAIDGAVAAHWLAAFRRHIEKPEPFVP